MKVKQIKAGRVVALGAAAAVAAASVLVAPSASAAPACNGGQSYRGDVDGDDVPDTVVGVPNHASSKGAVDLHLADGTSKLIDSSAAGVTPRAGDQFGRSVALGDLDADGCDDLVVGAPGAPGGGYAAVILGGPTGIAASGHFVIENPGASGDEFGTSLGLSRGYTTPTGSTSLWVGAPGATVTGKSDAGAVYHFDLRTQDDDVSATRLGKVTTNTVGLGAGAQAGERVGEVLTVAGDGSVVHLGVPRRDVDGEEDAGAVVTVSAAYRDGHGGKPTYSATLRTQNTKGVPDKAEAGDRFGAAIAAVNDDRFAVGVPGEDVWKVKKKSLRGLSKKAKRKVVRKAQKAGTDVGAVQLFVMGRPLALATRTARYQGLDVPGSNTRGDRFGASLAYVQGLFCDGVDALAVGVPGADVVLKKAKKATKKKKAKKAKLAKNAGAVIVLADDASDSSCRPTLLAQGKGLAGKAERGDAAGTAIAAVRDRDAYQGRTDRLLVGVPGEDVGSFVDAGEVNGYADVNRTGGPVAGLGYGSVLASVVQG
jgi:hypothetical protein